MHERCNSIVNSNQITHAQGHEPIVETPALDPMERISELLFGLIMVLTFTCSFSVIGAARKMLLGALGCNLAWGIIDAVFYLMSRLSEQGHNILTLRRVRNVADPAKAHRVIANALPPLLASVLPEAEFEMMRPKLNRLPEPPAHPRLAKDDWRAAVRVFLLVFLSTFPVTLPRSSSSIRPDWPCASRTP